MLIEADDWVQMRQRGSHHQYRHPVKTGTVTVAGKPSIEIPAGTLNSILKQAGLKKRDHMQYLVVIEQGSASFGAYVPDLPGCAAVGESRAEVTRLIEEAVQFHVEGLKEDGFPVPGPHSSGELVEARV